MISSADISGNGLYRFKLTRETDDPMKNGVVLFVLNNPSTADAESDDATSRRGLDYTARWGYRKMYFGNTNPFRSRDPKAAIIPDEDVLKWNDQCLINMAVEADIIVASWGAKANKVLTARALKCLTSVKDVYALAFTNDGVPKHLLYLKKDQRLMRWKRKK